MRYSRIIPCVSFRNGRSQVTHRLVELVFETCTFVGPAVGAKKKDICLSFHRKFLNMYKDPCNRVKIPIFSLQVRRSIDLNTSWYT